MKAVTLPSGAELKIGMAPFADAKALYKAMAAEVKALQIKGSDELDHNFFKDMLATALSSDKIEAALTVVMKRSTYNGQKITEQTWEPVEAREDYFKACMEVAKENLAPFTKHLYAEFSATLGALTGKVQA